MGTVKQLPATNGKAADTVIATENKSQPQKPETQKPETQTPKPEIKPEPRTNTLQLAPLEDRFLKMDELYAHRTKWERLKDTQEKLSKFKLSTDGRADNITLSDGKGCTFSTYNAEVFNKVVEMLKEDVAAKLKATEALIIL